MRPLTRLAAALVLACGAVPAAAGWWDDAGAARRASLEDVRKDPDRWRDVTVVLDVRFGALADPGNSYFTRFAAREWRAVGVYPAAATAAAMSAEEPFSRIFVRRGSEIEARLAELAKGRSMQLRAVVRDAVKGEPWIEVLDVAADGDPLTPEETAAIARGDELLDHDNSAAAETIFRGVVARRALPKSVQASLWRRIGQAAWRQKRVAETVDAYTACLALDPSDAATTEALAAARIALAALPPRAASEPVVPPAASVAPSVPSPPASFGGTPKRHLLPPSGMGDTPAPKADAETPKPPVPAPRPGDAPATKTPAPVPPAEEPPPAPAPKPQLAGPH